uniref:Uncharacterized protein n=1 Tax=Rhizophora mucronata TaxID=61149 RepID=A0A2P2QK01_RHIMU
MDEQSKFSRKLISSVKEKLAQLYFN